MKYDGNLEGQCEQYCTLDKLVLDKKTSRTAKMEDVIRNKVLIIDTYAIYMFYLDSGRIDVLYDLDDLQSSQDIEDARNTILMELAQV